MGIKNFKPVTPSLRWTNTQSFDEITKTQPEKSLLAVLKKSGGRNNQGRIATQHVGGGHKRKYRIVDFKRDKLDIPARVASIEYDPNRNSRIALLHYKDGEKRYIIAPSQIQVNDLVMSGPKAEVSPGNTLALKDIPVGIPVHNIELFKGRGAQLARSAGAQALIMAKEGEHAQVKLPSGEVRLISLDCKATIGQVGNLEFENISLGKAGRRRWLGRRSRVRAVAMNPVDHPMGGGEGKSSGGRHPCSPQGLLAKGLKTRRKGKPRDYILKARKK
jgi:large subunit ribosomal protein L2